MDSFEVLFEVLFVRTSIVSDFLAMATQIVWSEVICGNFLRPDLYRRVSFAVGDPNCVE